MRWPSASAPGSSTSRAPTRAAPRSDPVPQVLRGGSFGSYLTAAGPVKIGLVPKLPLTRIVSAGNVAGEGAKIVALSITERAAATAILHEVEYVELSGRADFNDLFIDLLSFPT